MRRKIKRVYIIEMQIGLERETLKIVSDEKLLKQYLEKYNDKYPHNRIVCKEAEYVEIV